MSNFEYLFRFFQLRLPDENKNKYSKFDTSKSMSYQGQNKRKILSLQKSINFDKKKYINIIYNLPNLVHRFETFRNVKENVIRVVHNFQM